MFYSKLINNFIDKTNEQESRYPLYSLDTSLHHLSNDILNNVVLGNYTLRDWSVMGDSIVAYIADFMAVHLYDDMICVGDIRFTIPMNRIDEYKDALNKLKAKLNLNQAV